MVQIGIAFQPNLLGVMSQFSQFKATLEKYIATATEKSAGVIGTSMQGFMIFQNPSGTLEGSIEVRMQDPYRAYIGSDLPYAKRRNDGFSGMTDSLGRFYPSDPGVFYANAAIEDPETLLEVAQAYIEAVYGAWQELIGNLPSGTNAVMGVLA